MTNSIPISAVEVVVYRTRSLELRDGGRSFLSHGSGHATLSLQAASWEPGDHVSSQVLPCEKAFSLQLLQTTAPSSGGKQGGYGDWHRTPLQITRNERTWSLV